MTWNPSDKSADITLSNGNATATAGATSWKSVRGQQGRSTGKYYFELVLGSASANGCMVGVGTEIPSLTTHMGASLYGWAYYNYSTGQKWNNNFAQAFGDSFTTGDVIGVAVDMDAGKIWWSKNGVWQASGDPAAGTSAAYSGLSGTVYPMYSPYNVDDYATLKELSEDLVYAPPAGFSAWSEVLITYAVNGSIVEELSADAFIASAFDAQTWELVAQVAFSGSTTFAIEGLLSEAPLFVTVAADQGQIWKPGTVYGLGDKVFPTAPSVTPYYYQRIAAGTSGVTEPTWATTPGAQVDDGAVPNAWELVERLIQPVTHGPLIPS